MEYLTSWKEILWSAAQQFGIQSMSGLAKVAATMLLLIVGIIAARLVAGAIRRLLVKLKIDQLNDRLADTAMFTEAIREYKFSKIFSRIVYYLLIIVLMISATETLGMLVVAEQLGDLVGYLPRLLSAAAIAVAGIFFASLVMQAVETTFTSFQIQNAAWIGKMVFYLLVAMVAIMALRHAGIDVSIITTNLSMIVGSVVLAFVISFVIGTRDIIPNIALSQQKDESVIRIGQRVRIGEHEGVVIEKNMLHVELDKGDRTVTIPNRLIGRYSNKYKV